MSTLHPRAASLRQLGFSSALGLLVRLEVCSARRLFTSYRDAKHRPSRSPAAMTSAY